jgi:hypothetical protein
MASTEPLLRSRPILYQFKTEFYHFRSDQVLGINRERASEIARLPDTFYIMDGKNADPVHSDCLTLFFSSPRSDTFKDWHSHAKITPLYFPVWSLDELQSCREQCYSTIEPKIVDKRYWQYGGIARYVFWTEEGEEPPSIKTAVQDANARKCILSAAEPSAMFESSHMLLHISVDDAMHFEHLTLASQYVGNLLFSKYYQETLDNMKSMLGNGGALAGHLFECYIQFLFKSCLCPELKMRSLEGLHFSDMLKLDLMHCLSADGSLSKLKLNPQKTKHFDSVPTTLSDDTYYIPSATNFSTIDALTKEIALQYCVTTIHPINGVETISKLAALYPRNELRLLFIVPESIVNQFEKQLVLTAKGKPPTNPPCIKQFVAGIPIGIDTSRGKKRRRES